MVRRLFVPVILVALVLGAAPSPASGLAERDVRPRHFSGDHFRCMYRCEERGEFRRPPRWWPRWGSWPPPESRPRPPARRSWHRPGCWLFCGHDAWGHGGSHPYWSGPNRWCGPGSWHRRSCWHHRHDDSGGSSGRHRHSRGRDS